MTPLFTAAVAVIGVTVVGRAARRLSHATGSLLCGIGATAVACDSIRASMPVPAAINAAAAAWNLWLWWNNGGGDNTRRRLRNLKKRFQGVRRTAPAPA